MRHRSGSFSTVGSFRTLSPITQLPSRKLVSRPVSGRDEGEVVNGFLLIQLNHKLAGVQSRLFDLGESQEVIDGGFDAVLS